MNTKESEINVVLRINDNLEEGDLDTILTFLPVQIRTRVMTSRPVSVRRQRAIAWRLLCDMLDFEYQIKGDFEIATQEKGKPYLPKYPSLYFSISHCKEAVACIIADKPVGIDIETLRPYNQNLALRTMNIQEMEYIRTSTCQDKAFIELWTMKESYLKMTGEGIRKNLQTLPLQHATFVTKTDLRQRFIYTWCRFKE